MTNVTDFVNTALQQKGKPYIFGTETSPLDPSPRAFDCSELVEWAAARTAITPKVPDGAYWQLEHAKQHGTTCTVREGIATFGALLFMGDGTGVGRDAITHVAISLGNGTTIEARGKAWGVGCWSAERGFDFAARIPGLDYEQHGAIDHRIPVRLKYAKGDKGSHVVFARKMLNIVWRQRINAKGKTGGAQIAITDTVDDEFIEAVREFQRYCDHFLQKMHGGRFDVSGFLGPKTIAALSDWVQVALKPKG